LKFGKFIFNDCYSILLKIEDDYAILDQLSSWI